MRAAASSVVHACGEVGGGFWRPSGSHRLARIRYERL